MGIVRTLPLVRRIAGLSPFGPIMGKELQTASRRMRNHWLRMLYLGGLLLFLLLIYVNYQPYANASVVARIQSQAELGKAFFGTFAMFCCIGMGLIGPILTSTAINGERLGNTLNVLLMTPITSWQIVSGKLFSRLLIALLLIGLSLPVLAVVRLLGGVELMQMIAVVCICTAFAISSAALGLFLSSLINRAYAVILLAYAIQGFLYLFIPFVIALTSSQFGTNSIIGLVCAIHPPFNVALLSFPEAPLPAGAPMRYWIPGILVQLSFATVLLVSSSWIVRRIGRSAGGPPVVPASPPVAPEPPVETAITPASSSATAVPVHIADPRHVGDNPVLWRERRRPLMGRRAAVALGLVALFLLVVSYGLLASVRALSEREVQVGYAFVFHTLLWLIVTVLSSTAIAQEKESDTWTLLMTTPLSPAEIVMGKVTGLYQRMFWPVLFVVLHFIWFIIGGVIDLEVVLLVLCLMITCNTLWAATGVYLSLRLRKVTTAVIANLLLGIFIYGGIPMILLILGEFFARNDDMAEVSLMGLPYTYMVTGISRLNRYPTQYYDNNIWLPTGSVTQTEFYAIAATVMLVHVLLAGLILMITVNRFDRIVGRATQHVR